MSGTVTTGTAGASNSLNAPGGAGGNAAEVISSQTLFVTTSTLTAGATGGNGGATFGAPAGFNGTATTSSTSTSITYTWGLGGNGASGAVGGVAGAGTVTLAGDTIGTLPTPNPSQILINAYAIGGVGGAGGSGAHGGTAGLTNTTTSAGFTTTNIGSQGGDGGVGGTGGPGGQASGAITNLTSYLGFGGTIDVSAVGGAGGSYQYAQNGGYGGNGGHGGAGGAGSAGGDGGSATASLTGSTVIAGNSLAFVVAARGGAGNQGEGGASGGTSLVGGVSTLAANGAGGAGGAAGAASATVASDTVAAGSTSQNGVLSIAAQVTTYTAAPGGLDPVTAGLRTGATGSTAVGTIAFTGNSVTVGDGTGAFGSYGSFTLQLSDLTAPNPADNTAVAGTIALSGVAGGNLQFSGNSFTGGGNSAFDLLVAGGGVTIDTLNNTISIAGSATNALSGFNKFTLDSKDTFIMGTSAETVTVSPDPDTLVLTQGHGSLLVNGVTATDTVLQFSGYGSAMNSLAQLQAATTISGGNTVITLAGDGTVTLAGTLWTANASTVSFAATACYAAGTRILTDRGERPVEALQAGDRVISAFGGTVPVVWIGHRSVNCRQHPRPRDVCPVRVAPGAFGPGLPARALTLSPDHAVYFRGALIPIRALINDATIIQDMVDRITYFHVELPAHDVIVAEGLPAESYLDTGNRAAFTNGHGPAMLHPDFALRVWEREACATLVHQGPALHAARQDLLARANLLGHATTDAPDLVVMVDGRTVLPHIVGTCHRFRLPASAHSVRLHSRHGVPAHLHADRADHRRLGVAVRAVRLDGIAVALDDPRLGGGWHQPEGIDGPTGWRWTDGDGQITLTGQTELMVDIAMTARYWITVPAAAAMAAEPTPYARLRMTGLKAKNY